MANVIPLVVGDPGATKAKPVMLVDPQGNPIGGTLSPSSAHSAITASASFTPAAAAYGAGDIMDVAKQLSFVDRNGIAVPAGSLIRILTSIVKIDVTAVPAGQTSYTLQTYSVTPPSDRLTMMHGRWRRPIWTPIMAPLHSAHLPILARRCTSRAIPGFRYQTSRRKLKRVRGTGHGRRTHGCRSCPSSAALRGRALMLGRDVVALLSRRNKITNGGNEAALMTSAYGTITASNGTVAQSTEQAANGLASAKYLCNTAASTSHYINLGTIPGTARLVFRGNVFIPTGSIARICLVDTSDGSFIPVLTTVKDAWVQFQVSRPPKGANWALAIGNNNNESVDAQAFYVDDLVIF
ncbi:hypothetical protein AJ88_03810 [Mesorhizobium amorphae CCBAU 01583]|nr:hypothetical protein AJ88_03810 [Mesorhizobium amorphae CCBAU 01583]